MSRRVQFSVALGVVAVLAVITLHPWISGAHALLRSHHPAQLVVPLFALIAALAASRQSPLFADVNHGAAHSPSLLLDLICLRLC